MTRTSLPLPLHPTRVHPHTGLALEAIGFRKTGAPIWPILGASGDDGGGGEGGSGGGNDDQGGSGSGGAGGSGGQGGDDKNAKDAEGNDLGFPKDTPVAEMSDKQAAAYWRNHARKHEGRVKDLTGDRTPDQVKAELAELAELKKAQQTPAEQALTEAKEQGKTEGIKAERTKTAAAIFKGALEANGVTGDDLDEYVANFNVANYIGDDGVDVTKITSFAKKLSSGKDTSTRRRDFGGGDRNDGGGSGRPGSAGKAEAERRFGKKDKQTT